MPKRIDKLEKILQRHKVKTEAPPPATPRERLLRGRRSRNVEDLRPNAPASTYAHLEPRRYARGSKASIRMGPTRPSARTSKPKPADKLEQWQKRAKKQGRKGV